MSTSESDEFTSADEGDDGSSWDPPTSGNGLSHEKSPSDTSEAVKHDTLESEPSLSNPSLPDKPDEISDKQSEDLISSTEKNNDKSEQICNLNDSAKELCISDTQRASSLDNFENSDTQCIQKPTLSTIYSESKPGDISTNHTVHQHQKNTHCEESCGKGKVEQTIQADCTDEPESLNSESTEKHEISKNLPANKNASRDACDVSCKEEEEKKSWNWNYWGSSIFSAATDSMTAIKSRVVHGLESVMDTVENNLGVPPAEELAKEHISQNEEPRETNSDAVNTAPKNTILSTLVSAIEGTGGRVITGGLDTLEMIGKTTMNVLQDGDPGLRRKRAMLIPENKSLSEVLREAREQEELEGLPEQAISLSNLFEKYEGFIHLEALEMLSKNCQLIVTQEITKYTGSELSEILNKHDMIQGMCELDYPDPDGSFDHDFENVLKKNMEINPTFNLIPLLDMDNATRCWIVDCCTEQDKGTVYDPSDLHRRAIDSMAKLCAMSMHLFHKTSEYLLINDIDIQLSVDKAQTLGNSLACEIAVIASKYSSCLNTAADDSENPDAVTPMITNVYLEATNCSTYIQNALKLLVPILQAKVLTS